MGTVSRVHTFASGAILTAAQLNNEFDNLLTSSAINGGLDATNLGVTAGQATASKALVVDASRNLADATGSNRINNLALSGTFESTGAVTASAGITSGGNIVSDTDSTDDLGTTGVRWANLFVDDVTVTNNVTIGGTLTLTGGITLNGNTTIGDSSADTLTVNSTITSNLIFTDATYDIGASGATRPRDLHLSRNALMGGTLGVTGLITATGGVSGNLSGNVTGGTISGSTGTFSGDLAVDTDTLFVDASADRVGINTASPTAPVDINTSGSTHLIFKYQDSSTQRSFIATNAGISTAYNGLVIGSNATQQGTQANTGLPSWYQRLGPTDATGDAWSVAYQAAGGSVVERLRIDASGNMGLGVTPSGYFADKFVVSAGNADGITIAASATSDVNYFLFADGTSGNAAYRGQIVYDHGNDIMQFATAAAAALTIDSSQRVGIGTDSPATILQLNETYGTAALSISDDSSAGDYLTFQIVGGQYNGGANEIQAINTTDLSLNVATARSLIFKTNNTERLRILSSGGMTFNGDTAAANALDDYEEGTYSVTDQSGAGLSFTVNSSRYVKVGKLVWIGIELVFPTTSDTNIVSISLPFAQSTAQRASLSCVTNRSDVTVQGYASTGTAILGIIESAASPVNVTNASLSGKYVIIGGVYEAA